VIFFFSNNDREKAKRDESVRVVVTRDKDDGRAEKFFCQEAKIRDPGGKQGEARYTL
jgi:hypothetical protein